MLHIKLIFHFNEESLLEAMPFQDLQLEEAEPNVWDSKDWQ